MSSLSSHYRGHQQYACTKCRLRKVKCDRLLARCTNCTQIDAHCTYTARRPRKAVKTQYGEVPQKQLLPAGTEASRNRQSPGHVPQTPPDSELDEDAVIPCELRDPTFRATNDYAQSDDGRLFVAKGKSRYINRHKTDQVADLHSVLATEIEAQDNGDTPSMTSMNWNDDRRKYALLTSMNTTQNLRDYHPSPGVMQLMWDYYVCNVDILVKVLHKPTVDALILDATREHEYLSASTDALLFAIWLGTVTTMTSEQCKCLLRKDRSSLRQHYQFALEQALARAGWMTTQETVVLQALVLYMMFAPGTDSRSTWTLSGIAMGLAQAMGMHTDSSSFSLSVIDTEVRRRIWWTLCVLDNRISEDCGLETHVPLAMSTKLPLHINDADLDDLGTADIEVLKSRNEFTEMTVSLSRIEFAETSLKIKRLQYISPSTYGKETEILARAKIRHYEDTYLKYLDNSMHLHRTFYLGVRFLIAKLWKLAYDAFQRTSDLQNAIMEEQLLLYHTDVLELAHQLPDTFRQYGWFFRCKYTQWHAMAYLLVEFSKNPRSPSADRAWAVLEEVFDGLDINNGPYSANEDKRNRLWQPMLKLFEKAQQKRQQRSGQDLRNMSSTPESGSEWNIRTPDLGYSEFLTGDPLWNSEVDSGDYFDWDQLDNLVQDCQTGVF